MKHLKQHSIIVIILLAVITAFLVFLRIYFAYLYPEKMLKDNVREFFMENFNKAITLDEVNITTTGNLVIQNLNVSIGSDFNDNISLIACSEAIIDMKFIPMLRGKTVVTGMDFRKAMVTIVKNYGKRYGETFKSIFLSINDVNNMESIDMSTLNVSLNGTIVYREILRDDRFELKVRSVNLNTRFRSNRITYDLSGTLFPHGSVEIGDGSISMDGVINFNEGYEYNKSRHKIRMNNFDLSYGNIFIKEHDIAKVNAGGGVTLDGTLAHGDNKLVGDVEIELNNLGLYYHADPSQPFATVSNENCNVSLDFTANLADNRISVSKFSVYDDRISIKGAFGYENNDQKHSVELEAKSNKINLEDVSRYIVPYQNLSYSGELAVECDVGYNIRESHAERLNIDVQLKNSSASVFRNGSDIPVFTDGMIKIKGHPESLVLKMSARRNRSDLACEMYSDVATWYPYSGNSVISFKSSVMEVENISRVMITSITELYNQALIDAGEGYDETYFTQTTAGDFMVNNDISLNIVFQKLLAGKEGSINNCILSLKSDRGRVSLKQFEMNGYNGQYDFNCEGYFNRDYPLFSMEGRVSSFELDGFCRDAGTGASTGTLFLSFDFEVNAYRLYHLLNNGRGSFNFFINDGKLEGTELQKKLQQFFSESGYNASSLARINYASAGISVKHYGRNWYVRNIQLDGDSLSFRGRGHYKLEEGLDLPLHATVEVQSKEKDGTVKEKIEKRGVPLVIEGSPAKPILMNRKEKEKKSLTIFNIN